MSLLYSIYGYFGHLCEVPKDVLDNLHENYEYVTQNVHTNMRNTTYKQWFLQDTKTEDVFTYNDADWTVWNDQDRLRRTKDFFNQYVSEIFRFRFSFLEKNNSVDFHSKHMLPRIHIPLNDNDSYFEVIDEKGNTHSYKLEYGHAHFINVTYKHRVVGSNSNARKNSFFCFKEFSDRKIAEKFLK